MTRRTLSPAARGVLLAVSAALRSRVVVISDAADGTTTATVTEPDGTVLLRCAVRAVSPRRDSRQLGLPLVPGPQHEAPPPVAVVPARDDDGPAPIHGVCVGDRITLDDEPIEVTGVDHEGFAWRTVATVRGRSVDEGECLWSEVEDLGRGAWRVLPVDMETPAKAKRETAAKPKRAGKATGPDRSEPARIHGMVRGERILVDDVLCEVRGVDGDGVCYCPIDKTTAEGFVAASWSELTHVGDDRWETQGGREAPARGEDEVPAPAKRTPQPKPARLTAVPEADAVAKSHRGAILIAWQQTEGAAWERVWSAPSPKAAEIDSAWRAACEGHRARQYNRGGRCVRDSRDGAALPAEG